MAIRYRWEDSTIGFAAKKRRFSWLQRVHFATLGQIATIKGLWSLPLRLKVWGHIFKLKILPKIVCVYFEASFWWLWISRRWPFKQTSPQVVAMFIENNDILMRVIVIMLFYTRFLIQNRPIFSQGNGVKVPPFEFLKNIICAYVFFLYGCFSSCK